MVGFPQIIGCIKYYHLRTPAKNFGTIFIWVIVLGIVGIIAHVFFIDYVAGYYVGTVIAFIKSIAVKQENEPAADLQNATEDVFVSSIQIPDDAPDELKELYRKQQKVEEICWRVNKSITEWELIISLENDAKAAHLQGRVTDDEYKTYLEDLRYAPIQRSLAYDTLREAERSFSELQNQITQYRQEHESTTSNVEHQNT